MTTNRANTLRNSLAAAAAALVFGLAEPATAMEEVTAIGTTNLTADLKADFEAEMASYARAVGLDLRNTVLENLESSGAPMLRLARVNASHRG